MTQEDAAQRKKAIFDAMSPRARRRIERIGFDRWDPFEAPKDPIDIRRDPTQRTTQQLVGDFLQTRAPEKRTNAYSRGVLEMALGIINADDRFIGMFEFASWYVEQLKKIDNK